MLLDSVFTEKEENGFFSLGKTNKDIKSILFSRGRITESFFTEDSGLYITPLQQKLIEQGIRIDEKTNIFDGISARIVNNYREIKPSEHDFLYERLLSKYEEIRQNFSDLPQNFMRRMSLMRLYNLSIASAIILGMVSMTFIYRYLGVGASAIGDTHKVITSAPVEQVLGEEDIKNNVDMDIEKYIEDVVAESEKMEKDEFEKKITNMVKGYPIEKMVPDIMKKDKMVAAFLIGIAKKESGWGVHVPVLDGKDCYNYWGYRGQRKLMGTGGHTCFNSREDAVDTVAKRLNTLIKEKNLDTPAKMSIWKCGSACNKDGQVGKWISDVDMYFRKLNN